MAAIAVLSIVVDGQSAIAGGSSIADFDVSGRFVCQLTISASIFRFGRPSSILGGAGCSCIALCGNLRLGKVATVCWACARCFFFDKSVQCQTRTVCGVLVLRFPRRCSPYELNLNPQRGQTVPS